MAILSQRRDLDDASVTSWVRSAEAIDKISNHILRGNAMGTFQAEVGLWQILARTVWDLAILVREVVIFKSKINAPSQKW